MARNARSVTGWSVTVVVVALVLAQFVPYPRHASSPPFRAQPDWDSSETWVLASRACFDCHSNQTARPWYSRVAPISWLMERDVERARRALNFSEWDRAQPRAVEAGDFVREWRMPPSRWTLLRPHVALSAEDRLALAAGLDRTFGVVREPPMGITEPQLFELGF